MLNGITTGSLNWIPRKAFIRNSKEVLAPSKLLLSATKSLGFGANPQILPIDEKFSSTSDKTLPFDLAVWTLCMPTTLASFAGQGFAQEIEPQVMTATAEKIIAIDFTICSIANS